MPSKRSNGRQVSIEELKERFFYKDGDLFRRKPWNGSILITRTSRLYGYKTTTIRGKDFQVHRIVWALFHGKWPEGMIDHIDGDVKNNNIKNLRDVTASENQQNLKLHREGRPCGVAYHAQTGKWQALMPKNYKSYSCKKRIYIGLYATAHEAGAAIEKFYLEQK